jgi:hypothetical protein
VEEWFRVCTSEGREKGRLVQCSNQERSECTYSRREKNGEEIALRKEDKEGDRTLIRKGKSDRDPTQEGDEWYRLVLMK